MHASSKKLLLVSSCLTGAASIVLPYMAAANPQGGVVSQGSANIVETGSKLDVHQHTHKAVIDWTSFNIEAGEHTQFHQPSSSAVALNRVNDANPSHIMGKFSANGNIILINPNGVFFGAGSQVDVNSLVVSTADITNDDFMAGNLHFNQAGNANAKIVNEGTITAKEAGLVGLVAPQVENHGVIRAKLGRVQLASADTFALDLYGDGLLSIAVSDAVSSQVVENTGSIDAAGGTIMLTAAAGKQIVDSLITVKGELKAPAVSQKGGRIIIAAEGSNAVKGNIAANKGVKSGNSTVVVQATLDASGKADGQQGGSIEITGDQIALLNGTTLDTTGHSGATGTTDGKAVSADRTGAAGGDIKVGGDYLGGGDTAAAKLLYVEEGVNIHNDAIASGDAGRSIFWSDQTTSFAGHVTATGGASGGNGGFVEVSGKSTLGFTGLVDLRSALGEQGTLLLDPTDITISTAADTGSMSWDGTSFTDTAATPSNLNTTTLQNQLALSNVIVSTASAQGGAGDITVNNTVTWNSGFGLTLDADNDIIVNADITNSGAGGITLDAGGDGAGDIDINSGSDIDAGLGALTLNAVGGSIEIAAGTVGLSGTGLTLNNVTNNASDLTLNAKTGNLAINAAINSSEDLFFVADNIDIAAAVNISGSVRHLYVDPYTISRQISLGDGVAGGLDMSSAELNNINFTGSNQRLYVGDRTTNISSDFYWGNHTWSSFGGSVAFGTFTTDTGVHHFQGAQNFNNERIHLYGGYNITGSIDNASRLEFYGQVGQDLTIGGAAGTTVIDSTELDRITSNITQMQFAALGAQTLEVEAYSNWKQGIVYFGNNGINNINGAQTGVAGTDFILGSTGTGDLSTYTYNINGDITATGNGYIVVNRATGGTVNLGANLISGSGGLNIRREITLTGAAGTTRTLNAGSGTLTLDDNGGSNNGNIIAGDKNLEIVADALSLTGTMSATTGGILLSPFTTTHSIGVGDGGAHDVSYSTAFVNMLKTNFAHYTFGRSTTGDITNYTAAWDDPVTFLSGTNFTSGAAITADDGVTINVGNDITLDHAITSTNDFIALTAGGDGAGNISIDEDLNANGALTLTSTGGTITLNNNADLFATGITINSPMFLNTTVGVARRFDAGTGAFTNNAAIDLNSKFFELVGDTLNINDNLNNSGGLRFAPKTLSNSVGLAGAAGDTTLSVAELNRISGSVFNVGGSVLGVVTGDLNVGAYTWNAYTNFTTTGTLNILGNQVYQYNPNFVANDFNIAGTLDLITPGTVALRFKSFSDLTLGGAAGTTIIDSAELDMIQDDFAFVSFGESSAIDITVDAYSGWKDQIIFANIGDLTINGAQGVAAGTNGFFRFDSRGFGSVTRVNADIDTRGGTAGNMIFNSVANTFVELGANLYSNSTIAIERHTDLIGAAGSTITIDSGTGLINLNGVTIDAFDKNLVLRGDSMTINGAISGDSNRTLTVLPNNLTRSMGVGSAATGSLSINDTELAFLDTHSGSLIFGDNTGTGGTYDYTGQIDINTAHDFGNTRFTTTTAGSTRISGDITHTNGGMNFWSPTLINGNRSITNLVNGGGVAFYGTINGVSGGENLTISQRNAINFFGSIGNINPLGDINLTSTFSSISLPTINASSLFVHTPWSSADITLNGVLTLSGAGTALELVSGDDIFNNVGAGVFNLTGGGRFLTWSDDPLEDTGEEHFSAASTKRYNRNYGDAVEPTGNIRNYSIAPNLTITPDNTQFTYGDASSVAGTFNITGWHMAEDAAANTMGGTTTFQTSYSQGDNAGTSYNVTNNGSTLTSSLGYGFTYAASASLSVDKADLRVKAVDLTFAQGDVPVVTFLYEPSDFLLGDTAATAGITGAPNVSNINFSTVATGLYDMELAFGSVSSTNYNFTEAFPRGKLTVIEGAPAVPPASVLPDTVRFVTNNAAAVNRINNAVGASNTNAKPTVDARTKQAKAPGPVTEVNLYDVFSNEVVTATPDNITISDGIMQEFGLTYTDNDS